MSLVFLAGLWWLLSGGDPASWWVGAPAVALSAWWLRRLGPAQGTPFSVTGLLRLVPFFLWESLRGGLDVTRRVLARPLRVRPGHTEYRTGLRRASARAFFANCVCLLPGTLAADLRGDRLALHLLDVRADPQEDLRRLERAVARLFPETQEPRTGSS